MAGTIAYRLEHDGSWLLRGSRLRPHVRAVVRRDPDTGDAVAMLGQEEVARVERGAFRDAARLLELLLIERGDLMRNGKWTAERAREIREARA